MTGIRAMCAAAAGLVMANSAPQHVTQPDITDADLAARIAIFAHDSMGGRLTGSAGHARAAAYITGELRRLDVAPAAERNWYAQIVPLVVTTLDSSRAVLSSRLDAQNYGVDFLPIPGSVRAPFPRSAPRNTLSLMYGGRLGDAYGPESALVRNSFVVFAPPLRSNRQPDYQVWNWAAMFNKYRLAGGIGIVALDVLPLSVRDQLSAGQLDFDPPVLTPPTPPVVLLSRAGAVSLLGAQFERLVPPAPIPRRIVSFQMLTRRERVAVPAVNLLAVVEGSDSRLRSEYIVLSAHIDHKGVAGDLDAAGGDRVFNGADDNASGAMALLEIAEYLHALREKPRRSILFLWTTGQEQGSLGARWFVRHSRIPLADVVANVNLDGIGRGAVTEGQEASPASVHVVGSKRVSAEFSSWVNEVNSRAGKPLQLDYLLDRPDQRMQYLCVGDQTPFLRAGIPSVLLTTGAHTDYHRVTDEAGQVDAASTAAIARFVAALAIDLANRPGRPRPDPGPVRGLPECPAVPGE